jgi:hypothetical protein
MKKSTRLLLNGAAAPMTTLLADGATVEAFRRAVGQAGPFRKPG